LRVEFPLYGQEKTDRDAGCVMNGKKEVSGHWFLELITLFSPDPERTGVTGTPETMIAQAGREAFAVSSAAALLPGPAGLVVIVPELIAVARIQLLLVHRVARYYGQSSSVDRSILLLIFGEALGLAVGKSLARRVGNRLVVRAIETQVARAMAEKIGARIVASAIRKALARYIPLVAAPLFGAFSRSMTVRIGRHADKLFSKGFTIEGHAGAGSGAGQSD
jgi:hypothetical protein